MEKYTIKKKKNKKRDRYIHIMIQKLLGAILLLMSSLIPYCCDGDITACIIFVPIGVYLLFTGKCVNLFPY